MRRVTTRHSISTGASRLLAEEIGIDYLFWMGKWKGFGGETGFWEQTLEPLTLVSGIVAATARIRLLATINPLLFHPTVAAKMITTIQEVSTGRFGMNVVTGNTLDEVEQMGVVPDGYNEYRYGYADEWMEVVYRLWSEKHVTFDGRFFHLSNCVSTETPADPPPAIVSAGTSDEGLRFRREVFGAHFHRHAAAADRKGQAARGRGWAFDQGIHQPIHCGAQPTRKRKPPTP